MVQTAFSSPLTTGQISSLLLRNLNAVKGSHQLLPNRYHRFFKPRKADMATMYEMEVRDPTWGEESGEGEQAPLATAGQGIETAYNMLMFTNSLFVTLPALQDNLYKDQWSPQAAGFVHSQDVLRNLALWSFLNNANNNLSQLGDGLPLFSTEHLLSEGTFANTFPQPTGMSKDSLFYAANSVSLYVSYALYPMYLKTLSLDIPVAQSQLAQTLLFSTQDPTTANRAINALNSGGYYSEGIQVNPYLQDPTFWIGRTDEEMGFVHWEYMPFMIETMPMSSAFVLGFASIERFGWGCGSARACFGSTMFA